MYFIKMPLHALCVGRFLVGNSNCNRVYTNQLANAKNTRMNPSTAAAVPLPLTREVGNRNQKFVKILALL